MWKASRRGSLCFAALVAASLAAACSPSAPSVPCNEDEDCDVEQVCLRGACAPGEKLGTRTDAGARADAGPLPGPLDAGPNDDASAPEDSGSADDAGSGDDAGQEVDAGPDVGSGVGADGGPPVVVDAGPPGIVSFAATPQTVAFGDSVTLAWVGNQIASCTLEGSLGALPSSGSLVLERPASRPYRLVCLDDEGGKHEALVTVTVSCSETTLASLVIGSDDDLAAFSSAGCVSVSGDVTIENVTTSDLSELYGLVNVGGHLKIAGNPNLSSLAGLEMLTTVAGDLRLGDQEVVLDPLMVLPLLTNLHGLSALETVGADVEIHMAASLVTLAGLERLVSVGSDLELTGNLALERLDGLSGLETIGEDLEITDCPSLPSLAGLSSLTSLGNSIVFSNLALLSDISALGGLSGDLYAIYLHNSDALQSLSGLEGITGLNGHLHLQYNSVLTNLDGLSQLAHAERVVVRRNHALVSADLPALETVDYVGEQLCAGDYCDGDLAIVDNDGLVTLSGFAALQYVRRNLVVTFNGALTSISAFPTLPIVNNDLFIDDNAALSSLTGLADLAEADDIFIRRNPELATLELASLTTVDDDLDITGNGLLSLGGLAQLESVGGNFVIAGHAKLETLGLTSLLSVGDFPTCSRGCTFHVRDNPVLPQTQVQALLDAVGRPVNADDLANVVVSGNGP